MEDKFKFEILKENIVKMKTQLPVVLGNHAQNFFTASWDKQGWDSTPWKDVKRHDESTNEYKYPIKLRARKLSSPILVGVYKGRSGGALRRATSRSLRSTTFESVRLVVDLPYAEAHNEGNPANNLPARPFMKQSRQLTKEQREKIKRFMDDLWQE